MKRTRCIALAVMVLIVSAGDVRADERVVLENTKTEWQNAYGAIIYTVLVNVKNVSDTPLQYVRIKVELFDKDGKPVAERMGYNVGAEILDDESAGTPEDKLKRVKPIAAGATDLIRLSLDKSDIGKPFRKTNVSVVEVR